MNYSLEVSGNWLVINLQPLVDGETPTLSGNTEYQVTLSQGISGYIGTSGYLLDSDYTFWFTSTYCPLFTTIRRVKLLTGPIGDSMLDDTIYRMIYKNSIDAIELYNLNYGTNYTDTSFGCTPDNAPFWLRRYVECKTAYDVIAFVNMAGGGSTPAGAGDQLKTLGDMTIKYGGASSSSAKSISGNPPKSKMEELYECFNEAMRMIKNMNPAVRGFYSTSKGYPHPVRDATINRTYKTHLFRTDHYRTPGYPEEERLI